MLRNFLLLPLLLAGTLHAGIDLRLPTDNHFLFENQPDRFYMYVDRVFEGQTSKPWEGGSYGYVRNAIRVGNQVVLTKFHEGIDIKPLKRDSAGNPLDPVSSIAEGKVVHASLVASHSNYGKYVVIEHTWDNSPVYSLYAHLAEISCKPGDEVKSGSVIGRMGFTGAGIDRTRAHLHLEVAMMLSTRYEEWAKGTINHHGNFNGMNLTGADVARFFIEQKANPELSFSEFIKSTPVYFKVAAPAKEIPEFVTRYPWICKGNPEKSPAWEISFSSTGMPVAFAPVQRNLEIPIVTAVQPSKIPQRYLTHNLITGQDNQVTLTESGKRLVAMLMNDLPAPEVPNATTKQ